MRDSHMLKLSGERSEPGFFGAAGENFVDFEVRNAIFQADSRVLDFQRPLWRDLILRKIGRDPLESDSECEDAVAHPLR